MPLETLNKPSKPGVASECGLENMEPEALDKAMDAAINRKDSDLKLTEDEKEKFKRAFKDAEFRKMMAEYSTPRRSLSRLSATGRSSRRRTAAALAPPSRARTHRYVDEISDPKHRAEQNERGAPRGAYRAVGIAATPRLPRGAFRGDESRRRRGRDVDIPRRRVAVPGFVARFE